MYIIPVLVLAIFYFVMFSAINYYDCRDKIEQEEQYERMMRRFRK